MKPNAVIVSIFSLTSLLLSVAEASSQLEKTLESCHQQVQSFYAWYVPLMNDDKLKRDASEVAIEQKPELFDTALIKALKDDADAQHKSKDYIVGIDFEPFVGGQDPARAYVVGKGEIRNGTCTVTIQANDPNFAKQSQPDVIVQLEFKNGWKFTNFLYPPVKGDLVSTLKVLKKARDKR